jgi:hypothetical protein
MTEEHMRTTVVLKDDLVKKAKKLSGEATLSGLLNSCLEDWIAHHSRKELKARLVEEYRSGRKEARQISAEFGNVDKDSWPSW